MHLLLANLITAGTVLVGLFYALNFSFDQALSSDDVRRIDGRSQYAPVSGYRTLCLTHCIDLRIQQRTCYRAAVYRCLLGTAPYDL